MSEKNMKIPVLIPDLLPARILVPGPSEQSVQN